MRNKSLKFSILILLSILITKLFFHFKAVYNLPYYHLMDLSNHMSRIYFLAMYGFHGFVPNWYNGFILFESYLPGFFYFALPFYLLTKSIVITTIISIILIYILGFIFIYFLGKTQKLTILEIIALYLFFFASPQLIIGYLSLGRIPELFAWILFIPFLTLILYYKDHKLNKKSILIIIFYSLISMSHIYILGIATFLFIPLLLIKNIKEKLILISYVIIGLAISSFAWLSFLNILDKPLDMFKPLKELLTVGSIISYNTFFLIFFFVTLFLYLKNKTKREKIFFLPFIVLSVLLLTRIAVFIPLLNNIPATTYNLFFLLIGLILFLKTKLPKYILLIIAILSIFIVAQQPLLGVGTEDKLLMDDAVKLVPSVGNGFIILTDGYSFPYKSLMTYMVVNYNLSTGSGESPPDIRTESLENGIYEDILLFSTDFKSDCSLLRKSMEGELNVKEIISHDEYCNLLNECGLIKIKQIGRVCLYKDNK